MSTIAWRTIDGVMYVAADGRVTSGDGTIVTDDAVKCVQMEDRDVWVVGDAGLIPAIDQSIKSALEIPADYEDQYTGMVLTILKDKLGICGVTLARYDTVPKDDGFIGVRTEMYIDQDLGAMGSGGDFAIMFMRTTPGGMPAQAVTAASRMDVYTGGTISMAKYERDSYAELE